MERTLRVCLAARPETKAGVSEISRSDLTEQSRCGIELIAPSGVKLSK